MERAKRCSLGLLALLCAACATTPPAPPRQPGAISGLALQDRLGNGFWRYRALAAEGRPMTLYADRPDLVAGPPRPTLVFVNGSGNATAFRRRKDGTLSGGMAGLFARYGPKDLVVVVVEKRGLDGFTPDGPLPPPSPEWLQNGVTLSDRKDQQAQAILGLVGLPSIEGHRVVLAGHSEGAEVAAAVAAQLGAARISHLVFLGCGGVTQMFDALVLARRYYARLAPATREKRLADLRGKFSEILGHPDERGEWMGEPIRRWASFLPHEPLKDLLALQGVPIFVGQGAEDESVPVESADLIAAEFLRRGRKDLTYHVYPGANHSFTGHEDALFHDIFAWLSR